MSATNETGKKINDQLLEMIHGPKKPRLLSRKARRAEAKVKGVAFVPQYNRPKHGIPNRHNRRTMAKGWRVQLAEFRTGRWARTFGIAVRAFLRARA